MNGGRLMELAGSEELDARVLYGYPYPIAINHRRLLEAELAELKVRQCIVSFETAVRFSALSMVSQYLGPGRNAPSNAYLNQLLIRRFPRATLGSWVEILFAALSAFSGNLSGLLFSPEIDRSFFGLHSEPVLLRKQVRSQYDRIVQIRNDLVHRMPPLDEAAWTDLLQEILPKWYAVLESLAFLSRCELVLTERRIGGSVQVLRFTGPQPVTTIMAMPVGSDPKKDHFYLARVDSQRWLDLHQLIVPVKDDKDVTAPVDAALFSALDTSAVEYSATVLRRAVRFQTSDEVFHTLSKILASIEEGEISAETVRSRLLEVESTEKLLGYREALANPEFCAIAEARCPHIVLQASGPNEYFVAHEFSEAQSDLRTALEHGLSQFGLTPYYADAELTGGHILCKICQRIRSSGFNLFDVTLPNPNIYVELGLAFAFGRPVFLIRIKKSGVASALPEGLASWDILEYPNFTQLRESIGAKLEDSLGQRLRDKAQTNLRRTIRSIDPIPGSFVILTPSVDVERSVCEALAESKFEPLPESGTASLFDLESVAGRVQRAAIVVCDISPDRSEAAADTWNPGIFLQLGMSIGFGKPVIIVCRKGSPIPADLRGLDAVKFTNLGDLKRQLQDKGRGFIGRTHA